jgi:hypothetical protein
MVNIELRYKTQNRVRVFAKLLANGANVAYTLKDIEKDAYNEYLNDLKYKQLPTTQKRRIAKELVKLDIQTALDEIQRG